MQKLKELKNYMALQMYFFSNSVKETRQEAVVEVKDLFREAIG